MSDKVILISFLAGPHPQAIQIWCSFCCKVDLEISWSHFFSNGPPKSWFLHANEWDRGHWPIFWPNHILDQKYPCFFPNFEKNPNLQKKFFLKSGVFIQSTHTQAIFFLLTKHDINVHYNKFPYLEVYQATFPNLKGPRAPSQYWNKKSL